MKRCERCPNCGRPLPIKRTVSMTVRYAVEVFQGTRIVMHREQTTACPECGITGRRMVYIGETMWENDRSTAATCATHDKDMERSPAS